VDDRTALSGRYQRTTATEMILAVLRTRCGCTRELIIPAPEKEIPNRAGLPDTHIACSRWPTGGNPPNPLPTIQAVRQGRRSLRVPGVGLTLEQLLTSTKAFNLPSATPLQRAITRAAAGLPTRLPIDDVRKYFGAEPTIRPDLVVLVCGVRSGRH